MKAPQCLIATVVGAFALLHALTGAASPESESAVAQDRLPAAILELKRQIRIGFSLAPVELNLEGRNRGLVGLGSYLINGPMDCVGCHHADRYLPAGDPFLGEPETLNTATYLGGGVPFGPFVSRNLTPDKNGQPAGLSLWEFTDVMRNGTDYKGLLPEPTLLQVMPWPAYRHSTRWAIRAMYAYLSSIPCLEGGPGVPVNRCGP